MKIQSPFLLFFLLLLSCGSCLNAETIKGNGKIVTREVNVNGFDKIILSVPATINFIQGENFSCSITIDENLLDYYSFKVVGDGLFIRQLPTKDGKPLVSFNFGEKEVNLPFYKYPKLDFTKFVIDITAPRLEDVKVNGSGSFNIVSDFSDVKLDVDVVGSGSFVANKLLNINKLDIVVAGSGYAQLAQVEAQEAETTIHGSGDVSLNGVFSELDFEVAGSGNIKMTGNSVMAKAKIAGSGSIRMGEISQMLKYDIAGSGNIYYSGEAELKGFVAGSGSIQKK